ncbi:Phosphopantothenoylcysteine decarboxylase [Penicillium malachiteum]|uniref:Phosphopantothenoylcysteine decarboxylase n=1 Tax=Penicillium malachiteum TaxID=1324776 RepID=UPI0025466D3A|nr:Phosphopantothenoylcysteine decarboxylase [Penicillium malachiteum]KAJ5736300.1 Phosphopantothenoylcysteine decarboxylase [Penicillium malachiteum]
MAFLRSSASVFSAVCRQSANSRLSQSAASVQTSNMSSLSTRSASYSLRPSFSSTLSIRSTRTFLTHLRREAQALKEQPISSSTPIPPTTQAPAPLRVNNLPYFVRRTGSNQLPVYLDKKAGGTKQLTKIQKTEGDLEAFREDLARSLGVDLRSSDVSVNKLTGHIVVKGWRKPEIVKFLRERNF